MCDRDLKRLCPSRPDKVQHHLLNLQTLVLNIRRKVVTTGAEADHHRRGRLVGVMQVIPLVGELLPEAEPAIRVERPIEALDNLLTEVVAVERRVFDGDENVSERTIGK